MQKTGDPEFFITLRVKKKKKKTSLKQKKLNNEKNN